MKEARPANPTIAHYRLIAQLGVGGMGEVWLAEDTRLDRKVALKLLPVQWTQDSERVRRFIQEARAASALNHPNILTIHEIGQHEDQHYIVTEYIEGPTLRQRLTGARLTLPESLDIAAQVAGALQAAHSSGIVHRDIKPENIMLRPDGYVKVLDFGVAKLLEVRPAESGMQPEENAETLLQTAADTPPPALRTPHSTAPGTVMGTPSYMSPEQARGLSVDARSDLFSLGIVLYEMLAGRLPFSGPTMSDVLVAILTAQPQPLVQVDPATPPELDRVVMKSLGKNCAERYQSANELLAELRRLRQQVDLNEAVTLAVSSADAFATNRQGVTAQASGRRARTRRVIDSLAVLPLVNVGGDEEFEYLSEGITESIINSLSQVPKLRVVPRSVVFRYGGRKVDAQQAGEELGVRAVLTGRMRKLAGHLVIRVELIDVAKQAQLWGEQYRRRLTDIFELQEEIAREISQQLRLKLSGAEKKRLAHRYTDNTAAYHLYLKGRHFTSTRRTENWIRKGIEHFQQAIDLDPNYALAYAGMADAYAFLASSTGGLPPREVFPKAIAAAQKALALDDTLGEAHCSLGFARLLYEWDFDGADREFRRAIELTPHYANAHDGYGFYLKATGQYEAAVRECEQAARLDPLSPFAALSLGWAHYFARQFDRAIDCGLKVLELNPHFAFAWKVIGMTYGQQGAFDAAIDALEKAVALAEDVTDFKVHLACVSGRAGHHEVAQRMLAELEQLAGRRYTPSFYFVLLWLGLGDRDQALWWLDKACDERSGFMAFLNVEPLLDPLRADPRFSELLHRVMPTH